MNRWARTMQVIAGLAVLFVAVSAAAQAIRQGSWGPVVEVGWLPAVIVAISPGAYRRCRPRRNREAGVS